MTIDYRRLIHNDRVHGSLYVAPEVYADEMQRIFFAGWSFCALTSEIPRSGDWITRRIGAAHYVVARDRDERVQVFANRCAHRGTALCVRERGHDQRLQCPYHGWTYTLAGRLAGVPYGEGQMREKAELSLDRPGQIDSYRDFLFVNPSGTAGTLAQHLGAGGRALIDRLCDLSPTGHIRLAPTWIGHRIASNWKMWPESDNDGYHFPFVHASMVKAADDSYYQDTVLGGEFGNASQTLDVGAGHFALEMAPSYPAPLAWLGTTVDKEATYVGALQAAHGVARADELLWAGPPHAMIFPNLFLGEMNLAIVEPRGPALTIQHHTAVQFEGVEPRFNRRILRQSEAALGPASFIVPDDAVTAERMQLGFSGAEDHRLDAEPPAGWIDLSRGLARETTAADGRRIGRISDETTNRAFWRHYCKVMTACLP